ncbi:tetratricopeptide repeat protein [Taibaiella lutea]|uniref:Tetratricopeptide repeat protein n=1 Tax=Taibaiella lutea TaxID=2608001 RepID=A0A5M6CKX5_9BACT|nr:tetratricopeptide repeat protein [Taibaiella lutea]KAA5534632.1 tetratricopeptide repeat protein [Taibaiella lutea]
MKKLTFYLRNFLLYGALYLLISMSFSACSQNREDNEEVVINDAVSVPKLLPRKTATGTQEENAQIVKTYNEALEALKVNAGDSKQYLKLASVYITEGRVTGNNGYYSGAALKMLDKVISSKPEDSNILFESLSLKSAVLLNLHQFREALAVAEEGRKLNAYNAGIYGALVDANVEMGNYSEAVKDCDQMLTIRPDLRSYSRASYLRQIYGDNKGAITAMRMAVESGVPGMESTEWSRVNWGNLYLNTGQLDTARMIYETTLSYRPGYAPAEMGLAKVYAAQKKYDAAVIHAKNAIRVLSEASYVAYLGELYMMMGDKAKAMDVNKEVVRLLEENEKEQTKGTIAKHNGNRELALAYLNVNEYDKALEYASIDYKMRPNNIDANDLMSWIYYKKGNYTEAKKYSSVVFQTKIKNADMLYKSGLIYAAAGDQTTAAKLKKDAISVSPYIDASYQ